MNRSGEDGRSTLGNAFAPTNYGSGRDPELSRCICISWPGNRRWQALPIFKLQDSYSNRPLYHSGRHNPSSISSHKASSQLHIEPTSPDLHPPSTTCGELHINIPLLPRELPLPNSHFLTEYPSFCSFLLLCWFIIVLVSRGKDTKESQTSCLRIPEPGLATSLATARSELSTWGSPGNSYTSR